MYCHDLEVMSSCGGHEVMSSNPSRVELILIYQGVHCCTKVCNLHVLQTERVVIQPESSGWVELGVLGTSVVSCT